MHTRDFRQLPAIDDLLLAFLLLQRGWNDGTQRKLMTPLERAPYIEKKIYGSGYTGDEYSGSEYYLVTDRLVTLLKQGHYLEGQKHHGYTDEQELSLRQEEFVHNGQRSLRQEFAEEARLFLVEKYPDTLLPSKPETAVDACFGILVEKLGYTFVALRLPDFGEGERAQQMSVHRTGGILKLWDHKFP